MKAFLEEMGLQSGSESKEYITCKAYPCDVNVPSPWQRLTTLQCVGHHIDDDAGISSCFSACFAAMCQPFYSKLTSGLLRASEAARYRVLNSCVRTVASFRSSRWHYTKSYASKLDALQRKLLTTLMQVPRLLGEPYDAFVQRRHVIGGHFATKCGRWSRA